MKPIRVHHWLLPTLATLSVVFLRGLHADQPIVENYVGRQVPTAMVARNLELGSGFLRPQLDTAPFPNLFLVEPPIYAQTVATLRLGLPWRREIIGRWVSAVATGLAAWGLYGLVQRRDGSGAAIVAVLAFGLFPVTIRYGRAFQPDALMLGLLVAGMRVWDDHEAEGGALRRYAAWLLIAAGLAVKIVSAFVLIPLIVAILRPPKAKKSLLVLTTLIPALLWYSHAAKLMGEGSRASSDNADLWVRSMGLAALFRPETWTISGRFLFVRSFTPLGFALAAWGLFGRRGCDRLWRVWLAATAAAFVLMAGKIHHEYYWMSLAPVMVVGVARAVYGGAMPFFTVSPRGRRQGEEAAVSGHVAVVSESMAGPPPHPDPLPQRERGPEGNPRFGRARLARVFLFVAFATLGLFQSRSTWSTPPEWRALDAAVEACRRIADPNWGGPIFAAPEALIGRMNARGFRLEVEPAARRRAAGEFGRSIDTDDPLALLRFYRSRGARYVVDLWPVGEEPHRRLLHDAIRRRYNVIIDRDGVILAELIDQSAP
ncbi:MAG: hypothetical protein JWN86_3020 [Planctomycetota bacterium]|nr:hypothetical protein [Planctomycetota bacterium]